MGKFIGRRCKLTISYEGIIDGKTTMIDKKVGGLCLRYAKHRSRVKFDDVADMAEKELHEMRSDGTTRITSDRVTEIEPQAKKQGTRGRKPKAATPAPTNPSDLPYATPASTYNTESQSSDTVAEDNTAEAVEEDNSMPEEATV